MSKRHLPSDDLQQLHIRQFLNRSHQDLRQQILLNVRSWDDVALFPARYILSQPVTHTTIWQVGAMVQGSKFTNTLCNWTHFETWYYKPPENVHITIMQYLHKNSKNQHATLLTQEFNTVLEIASLLSTEIRPSHYSITNSIMRS